MDNEEWGMGNAEWAMRNGEWGIRIRKWKMGNGNGKLKWEIENWTCKFFTLTSYNVE